jgi:hypothetical protein
MSTVSLARSAPEAVTVTGVSLVTNALVAVNVAVVVPASTMTEAGTVSELLLLLKLTMVSTTGADESVTVPTMFFPPVTPMNGKVTVA